MENEIADLTVHKASWGAMKITRDSIKYLRESVFASLPGVAEIAIKLGLSKGFLDRSI